MTYRLISPVLSSSLKTFRVFSTYVSCRPYEHWDPTYYYKADPVEDNDPSLLTHHSSPMQRLVPLPPQRISDFMAPSITCRRKTHKVKMLLGSRFTVHGSAFSLRSSAFSLCAMPYALHAKAAPSAIFEGIETAALLICA